MQQVMIRNALPEDANALLAIYTPYVLNTPITFEVDVPASSDFKERIHSISSKYPYFVAILDKKIVGYAYATAFKGRAAYDWSVETSIYVDESFQGNGIGHVLYAALENALKKQHVRNVCACIVYPNPPSIAFHESFGYQTVAHFHKSGYKFDTWHDMIWMEKFINKHSAHPESFVPYPHLK